MVACGHRESEIGDYSVDKFRTYVAAANRVEAARRRNIVVDTHAAIAGAFGGEKAIKPHMEALDNALK